MRIFYLSTALEEGDFAILSEKAIHKPNPAGQNFHDKLINALSRFSSVESYSLIPSQEGWVKEKSFSPSSTLRRHYLEGASRKLPRFFLLPKSIERAIEKGCPDLGEGDVVCYDSLNLSLSKAAKLLKKRKGCKTIAILTDDPRNISGTKAFYQKRILANSSSCDGYFCLTEGLYRLFCKNGAPHLTKMGIVEGIGTMKSPLGKPYLYYGGALFAKDGTNALLKAYCLSKPNIDLLLAGHGPCEENCRIASKQNPRIHFLGQISKKDHYACLSNASLLINPRLYRESLDEVSIPSKVLEYLSSGRPILSTLSTPIKESYSSSINWLSEEGGDPTLALGDWFTKHIGKDGSLIDVIPNESAGQVKADLGPDAIGEALTSFCRSLGSK